MHLVSCDSPQEPLEAAPPSALLAEPVDGEHWDGFWSSDNYYVRCTRTDGAIEWFEVADDVSEPAAAAEARVLALRPTTRFQSRVSVVVAQSPAGRRMLVGSARRPSR